MFSNAINAVQNFNSIRINPFSPPSQTMLEVAGVGMLFFVSFMSVVNTIESWDKEFHELDVQDYVSRTFLIIYPVFVVSQLDPKPIANSLASAVTNLGQRVRAYLPF